MYHDGKLRKKKMKWNSSSSLSLSERHCRILNGWLFCIYCHWTGSRILMVGFIFFCLSCCCCLSERALDLTLAFCTFFYIVKFYINLLQKVLKNWAVSLPSLLINAYADMMHYFLGISYCCKHFVIENVVRHACKGIG